jgi:hypothetical protein
MVEYSRDPMFLEGYSIGEMERQALAGQNSEFRSTILYLHRELDDLYNIADKLFEMLDHNVDSHDNYTWCSEKFEILQKYKEFKNK